MVKEILLLGDARLYEPSSEVCEEEIEELSSVIKNLHDTLMDFRRKYHAGRAIAAPQIGIFKRMLYMCIEEPVVFLNPVLNFPDEEMMEVMDDCMSFPELIVKVRRHKRCQISYKDVEWKDCKMELSGDLAELIQHEYDHLDGILATMRAVDKRSYYFKSTIKEIKV